MLPTAILPLHSVFEAALRGKGCHNIHLRGCLWSSSVEDGCVLGNIPGLWENQMGSHLWIRFWTYKPLCIHKGPAAPSVPLRFASLLVLSVSKVGWDEGDGWKRPSSSLKTARGGETVRQWLQIKMLGTCQEADWNDPSLHRGLGPGRGVSCGPLEKAACGGILRGQQIYAVPPSSCDLSLY